MANRKRKRVDTGSLSEEAPASQRQKTSASTSDAPTPFYGSPGYVDLPKKASNSKESIKKYKQDIEYFQHHIPNMIERFKKTSNDLDKIGREMFTQGGLGQVGDKGQDFENLYESDQRLRALASKLLSAISQVDGVYSELRKAKKFLDRSEKFIDFSSDLNRKTDPDIRIRTKRSDEEYVDKVIEVKSTGKVNQRMFEQGIKNQLASAMNQLVKRKPRLNRDGTVHAAYKAVINIRFTDQNLRKITGLKTFAQFKKIAEDGVNTAIKSLQKDTDGPSKRPGDIEGFYKTNKNFPIIYMMCKAETVENHLSFKREANHLVPTWNGTELRGQSRFVIDFEFNQEPALIENKEFKKISFNALILSCPGEPDLRTFVSKQLLATPTDANKEKGFVELKK